MGIIDRLFRKKNKSESKMFFSNSQDLRASDSIAGLSDYAHPTFTEKRLGFHIYAKHIIELRDKMLNMKQGPEAMRLMTRFLLLEDRLKQWRKDIVIGESLVISREEDSNTIRIAVDPSKLEDAFSVEKFVIQERASDLSDKLTSTFQEIASKAKVSDDQMELIKHLILANNVVFRPDFSYGTFAEICCLTSASVTKTFEKYRYSEFDFSKDGQYQKLPWNTAGKNGYSICICVFQNDQIAKDAYDLHRHGMEWLGNRLYHISSWAYCQFRSTDADTLFIGMPCYSSIISSHRPDLLKDLTTKALVVLDQTNEVSINPDVLNAWRELEAILEYRGSNVLTIMHPETSEQTGG